MRQGADACDGTADGVVARAAANLRGGPAFHRMQIGRRGDRRANSRRIRGRPLSRGRRVCLEILGQCRLLEALIRIQGLQRICGGNAHHDEHCSPERAICQPLKASPVRRQTVHGRGLTGGNEKSWRTSQARTDGPIRTRTGTGRTVAHRAHHRLLTEVTHWPHLELRNLRNARTMTPHPRADPVQAAHARQVRITANKTAAVSVLLT